jgi:hypothetical protein
MKRIIASLAIVLLASPVWAGELDGEFAGIEGKGKKSGDKMLPASKGATLLSLLQTNAKETPAKGSELDAESPTQAFRTGWGGGWGRGWGGWGRGWGGWGRWLGLALLCNI